MAVPTVAIWSVIGLISGLGLGKQLHPWTPHVSLVKARVAMALVCGGVSAAVGWGFTGDPAVVAWWWLAIHSVGLSVVDLVSHRLPRPWVVMTAQGGLLVFLVVTSQSGDVGPLLRAMAACMAVFAVGLVWHDFAGSDLGFGDVTVFAVVAFYCGWLGWRAVAIGLGAGVLLLGAVAAVLWAVGVCDRTSRIAAGPCLLAGPWVAVAMS
ncbi:hypothetical protein GIY23_12825 [Allosaccharopolyspora coralli]|uniref:Prepilin peptidase n=1 Tax=Allosaccharopolyspora coralli TaxID=2665642 RepID=A0A5Q3QFQ5_9PSEU|nr:hypothetical protein [Allosaccharopolyspora coralli]QGK70289.1 hypothetical protein GIY23_12825 [Allosaccharopolyspora coralli]